MEGILGRPWHNVIADGGGDEDPWILPLEILILQYFSHSITILDSKSLKNSNHFQGKLSAV